MNFVDDGIIDGRRFVFLDPVQHVVEPLAARPGVLPVVVAPEYLDLSLFGDLGQEPVPSFPGNEIMIKFIDVAQMLFPKFQRIPRPK